MPNYLRDFLRFQEPRMAPPQQDVTVTAPKPKLDQEYLRALMEEAEPSAPAPRRRAPRAMPTRPQATLADLVPQLLGGAADVATAYGGGRSDYQGRIMGMQQRQRDVSFEDALMARAAMEQHDREQEAADWRDYSTKISSQDRRFGRGMKYAELELMLQAMGKQREDQAKQDAFQNFMYQQGAGAKLKDVAGPGDLKEAGDAAMLQVRSPEELAVLQKMIADKQAAFDQQAASKKEFDDLLQQLVQQRMTAPGYSDPYGFGGLGLQAQLRPEVERILAERKKKSAKK